jgi:hypothetical protein
VTEQIRCGCTPPKHQHRVLAVKVVVPKAPVTAFVAQFTARTLQGLPATYTAVFVAGPHRWRAAIVTFEDDAQVVLTPPTRDEPQGNPATARKILNQFGNYLFTSALTGEVPTSTEALWSGVGPGEAARYVDHGQDQVNPNGIQQHYTRPTATPRAYAFQTAQGTLVCGTLNQKVALTAPGGQINQDAGRRNWGPSIAPGHYPRLVESFAHHVCLTVQPNGTRVVSSVYGTTTSIKPVGQTEPA